MFHGQFRRRIPWEVEKNLSRLVADWSEAAGAAIANLYEQALASVRHERATLAALLEHQPTTAEEVREALERLDGGGKRGDGIGSEDPQPPALSLM